MFLIPPLPDLRSGRRLLGLLVLVLASAGGLAAPQLARSSSSSIEGRVVGISDGDTLTLLDASRTPRKIRLAGIDAPEKAQPFGARAKQALSDFAFGKAARAECGRPDRYGRELCKVIVDGRDVNVAMIEVGMAWHYAAYAKTQAPRDALAYAQAQGRARAQHIGLWTDAAAMPPWEWRRTRNR